MYGEIARGLADVKIYVLGEGDVPGTAIDAPGARAFSWQAEQDSETWEGDDGVLATSQDAKTGTGSLTVGRGNPALFAAFMGTTAVVSGVDPDVITTVEESADPSDVYVMIKGQARSLDLGGSAYRVTLHKAMASSPSEKLELKTYNEPAFDFSFLENVDKKFITREWFKVRTEIPETIEEPAP